MANYHYLVGENPNGPFNLAEMEVLARKEQFSSETLVSREGNDWRPCNEFSELVSLLPSKAKIQKPKTEGDIMVFAFILGFIALTSGLCLALANGSEYRTLGLSLLGLVFCSVIGIIIGGARGRPGAGALWGTILGPAGWIIVCLIPPLLPKCSACRGVVDEQAKICSHCGVTLESPAPNKPLKPRTKSNPACPRCKTLVWPDALTCSKCGYKLK